MLCNAPMHYKKKVAHCKKLVPVTANWYPKPQTRTTVINSLQSWLYCRSYVQFCPFTRTLQFLPLINNIPTETSRKLTPAGKHDTHLSGSPWFSLTVIDSFTEDESQRKHSHHLEGSSSISGCDRSKYIDVNFLVQAKAILKLQRFRSNDGLGIHFKRNRFHLCW